MRNEGSRWLEQPGDLGWLYGGHTNGGVLSHTNILPTPAWWQLDFSSRQGGTWVVARALTPVALLYLPSQKMLLVFICF